jgi:hypothetical protein
MLSRALITATVMLLVGGFAAIPVRAENLEAGKSPSQIFAGTCTACHKGTRGLLKTVAPGSLPGFLRQHYTTSSDMAGVLSAYVLSNGATDTRGGGLTKQGQELTAPKPAGTPEQAEARPGHKPRAGAPAQEAAKPDADGLTGPGEPGPRHGRNARRLPNPEADKPAADGQPGAATASDTGPAGRGSAKQKLTKHGKPGREEPAKPDAARDAAKTEPAREQPAKSEPARTEPANSEAAKVETAPADDAKNDVKSDTRPEASKSETTRTEPGKIEPAKPEAGKTEANKGDPPVRPDPVPLVTPAPKPPEGEAKPAQTAAPASPPGSPTSTSTVSVSPSSGTSAEPPAGKPSVQASVPAPAPVPPAGPPAPPVSQ